MPQDEATQTVTGEDRVKEVEGLLAERGEALNKANARIAELEQTVAASGDRLGQLEGSLKQAIASYKTLVVRSNPVVLEELITGDSIEAIDQSLQSAKALVSRVKSGVEAEISRAKVPAGAPPRTRSVPQALSPREKIQQGIGSKR